MALNSTKLKIAALGALGASMGLSAAIVLSALQQLSVNSNVTPITSSAAPSYHISTSSFTTPPSSAVTTSSTGMSNTTTNWAGYVSTGGTYTSVSGSWHVPTVTANSEPVAADATWIGIGGATSNDLIQVGTQNTIENGQVSSSTFYERLPDTSVNIPTVNVNAGDTITAEIREVSSGSWTITISDTTNGETFSNTVAYNSTESSAEWIEEAPSVSSGIMPLDQFGSVTFTGGSTTKNGSNMTISGSGARAVTMEDEAGDVLTTISATDGTGGGVLRRPD